MIQTVSTDEFHALQARTMSESELLAAVRRTADAFGWRAYHTYRSDRSDPGFPDLVLVRGRRVLFVELKSARGKLTIDQARWLGDLGYVERVETHVWRPADYLNDTILEVLR